MKFLKKLLIFFKKKEETVKETVVDLELQNEFVDEIVNEEKSIDEENTHTISKDILSSLQFGDIIVGFRGTKEAREAMPIGHRKGPFIVLENTGTSCICAQGTSKECDDDNKVIFKLDVDKYNLKKDSSFYLFRIDDVSYDSIHIIADTLNEEDKNRLLSNITILKHRGYSFPREFNVPEYKFKEGDVVYRDDNVYMICFEDEKGYYALSLTMKKHQQYNSVVIDGRNFVVDYNVIFILDKDDKNKLYASCDKNRFKYIINQYKEHNKKLSKEKIQRGNIIFKNNKLYYVYGENGNKCMAFEISKYSTNGIHYIFVEEKTYYTDFNNEVIVDKNDKSYEIISMATSKELDDISSFRKKTIRSIKTEGEKKKNKTEFTYFLRGEVVETKTLSHDKYVIVEREHNGVYAVSLDSLELGQVDVEYLSLSFIKTLSEPLNDKQNAYVKKLIYNEKN